MNTIALGMSLASFVVVIGTWVLYFAKIPRNKVPVRPVGSVLLQCTGIALAVITIVEWGQNSGLFGAVIIIPAALAMMMGLFFLWLLTQRKTPIGDLKVKVGDRLLPFETTTSEGASFHTDELAGQRILMKFFRGGW